MTGAPYLTGFVVRQLGGFTVFTAVSDYEDFIRCHIPELFPDASPTLPSLKLSPRRVEVEQYAGSPLLTTQWTLTASFQSQEVLRIDPSALLFTGLHAADFSVQSQSGLPATVSCDQELDLVVDYTGSTNEGFAIGTLGMTGVHDPSGTSRSAQTDFQLSFYEPNLYYQPSRGWRETGGPCGGFGPSDTWSIAREILIDNDYQRRQRVNSVQAVGVDVGSISIDVATPPLRGLPPQDLEPGDAMLLQVTWSGTGPIPATGDQAELVFDVTDRSGDVFFEVRQPHELTFVEDCSVASLIAPGLLNFGLSEVNQAQQASLALQAYGSGDLEISAVQPCPSGPPNQPFSYAGPLPVVLPVGGTGALLFEVVPTSVGNHSGCFELVSDDPRGPHEVVLFTTTLPRTLEVAPDALEFGMNGHRVFQVINTGALPVRLRSSGVTVSGPFALRSPGGGPLSFPLDIAPGQFTDVEVFFNGSNESQAVDGSVQLTTNAADGEPTASGTVMVWYRP